MDDLKIPLWKKILMSLARHIMVLSGGIAGLFVLFTPIQLHIPMGRFQHYGLAIACFGLGFLMQVLFSWKALGKWGRTSYMTSFAFFALVGLAFYLNPWLDYRVSIQTQENEATKGILIICYLFCSLAVVGSWIKWILEENKQAENAE